ncbi:hypothetical protein C8R48DRAFT_677344 [Suillus tomentosus]|nr:hypothetical protein C8R48DRAFT_677344 [Suillus tomentosus]
MCSAGTIAISVFRGDVVHWDMTVHVFRGHNVHWNITGYKYQRLSRKCRSSGHNAPDITTHNVLNLISRDMTILVFQGDDVHCMYFFDFVKNIFRCFGSRFIHLTYEDHNLVTTNVQAVTHDKFKHSHYSTSPFHLHQFRSARIHKCDAPPSPSTQHLSPSLTDEVDMANFSVDAAYLSCHASVQNRSTRVLPIVHLLSLVLLLVSFPSLALVHRPYSSEPRQQLLTCAGRLRMVFVLLGTAWWSSDNFY